MSEDVHVVNVTIFGQDYPIRARVNEEAYILEVARFVDTKMREIEQEMKPDSTAKIAILAALNIADELFVTSREREEMLSAYREKLLSYTEALENSLDA